MVTDLSLKQWAADTRTRDVRIVAAHMKYASPELCLRNSEASQGKLPSSGCEAPALSSSVHTMRPRLARCCGLGSGSTTTLQHLSGAPWGSGDRCQYTAIFTTIFEGAKQIFLCRDLRVGSLLSHYSLYFVTFGLIFRRLRDKYFVVVHSCNC